MRTKKFPKSRDTQMTSLPVPTGAMVQKGALWKQSDHFKTWRRRYLELFPSHILYWEGDAPNGNPRGTIDLMSAISVQRTAADNGADLGLTIWCKSRTWELRADTEQECFAWFEALSYVVHQISSFTPFVARAEGWVQKKHGIFITSWHSCWCVIGADAVYLFESVALARKFCSCAPRRLISMPTPLLEALALDYICLKNGKVSGIVDIDGMPCGLEIFAPARRSQSFELIAKTRPEADLFLLGLGQAIDEANSGQVVASTAVAQVAASVHNLSVSSISSISVPVHRPSQLGGAATKVMSDLLWQPLSGPAFRKRGSTHMAALSQNADQPISVACVLGVDSVTIFDRTHSSEGEVNLLQYTAFRFNDTPPLNLKKLDAMLHSSLSDVQIENNVESKCVTLTWTATNVSLSLAFDKEDQHTDFHSQVFMSAEAAQLATSDIPLHDSYIARCQRLERHATQARAAVRQHISQTESMHISLLLDLVDSSSLLSSTVTHSALLVQNRVHLYPKQTAPLTAPPPAGHSMVFEFSRFEAKRADGLKVLFVCADGKSHKCLTHSVADTAALSAYVQRFAVAFFKTTPELADAATQARALLDAVHARWASKQYVIADEERAEAEENRQRQQSGLLAPQSPLGRVRAASMSEFCEPGDEDFSLADSKSAAKPDTDMLAVPLNEYESSLLGRVDTQFMAVLVQNRVHLTPFTEQLAAKSAKELLPCDPHAESDRFASLAPLVLSSLQLKRQGSNKMVGVDQNGVERKFAAVDGAAALALVQHVTKWTSKQ